MSVSTTNAGAIAARPPSATSPDADTGTNTTTEDTAAAAKAIASNTRPRVGSDRKFIASSCMPKSPLGLTGYGRIALGLSRGLAIRFEAHRLDLHVGVQPVLGRP